MKVELNETLKTWAKYAKVYDPIKCASIDGTDCEPHDRAVVRALNSTYRPNRFVKGRPECTIFISRLNHETSKDTIKDIFSKYGKLKRFRLVKDIVTGMPKGYAFVEYEEEQAAEEAYRLANKTMVDGNLIFVDFECERLLKDWKPRRLGGGFAGKKESGQLRFGGRDRPFKKPIALELKEHEDKRQNERERRRRDEEQSRRDKSRDRHKRKILPRETRGSSPPRKKEKRDSPLTDRAKRLPSPKENRAENSLSPTRKLSRHPSPKANDKSSRPGKNTNKDAESKKRQSPLQEKTRSCSPPSRNKDKTSPLKDSHVKPRSSRQEVVKPQSPSRENTKQALPSRERSNQKAAPKSKHDNRKTSSKETVTQESLTRESSNQRRRSPPKQELVRQQNGSSKPRSSERHVKSSPPRDRRRSPLPRKPKHSPDRDGERKRPAPPRHEMRPAEKHTRSRSPARANLSYNSPSSGRRTYNRRESPLRRQSEGDNERRRSPLQFGQDERGRDRSQRVSPRQNVSRSPTNRHVRSPPYENVARGHQFSSRNNYSPVRSPPSFNRRSERDVIRADISRKSDNRRSPVYQQARQYRGESPANVHGRRSPDQQEFLPRHETGYAFRENSHNDSYQTYSGPVPRITDDFQSSTFDRPYSPARVDFNKPPPSYTSYDPARSHSTFQGNIASFPPPREFPPSRDFYPSRDVPPPRDFHPARPEFHPRDDPGYFSPPRPSQRPHTRERDDYETRQYEEFSYRQNSTHDFPHMRGERKLPPSRGDGANRLGERGKLLENREGFRRY